MIQHYAAQKGVDHLAQDIDAQPVEWMWQDVTDEDRDCHSGAKAASIREICESNDSKRSYAGHATVRLYRRN